MTEAERVYCAVLLRIPVAERSKARTCGRSLAVNMAAIRARGHGCLSHVRVVSRDELITRQEQSYRECVSECDLEASTIGRIKPTSRKSSADDKKEYKRMQ
jgi:hypothetical protein